MGVGVSYERGTPIVTTPRFRVRCLRLYQFDQIVLHCTISAVVGGGFPDQQACPFKWFSNNIICVGNDNVTKPTAIVNIEKQHKPFNCFSNESGGVGAPMRSKVLEREMLGPILYEKIIKLKPFRQ